MRTHQYAAYAPATLPPVYFRQLALRHFSLLRYADELR